MTLALIVGQALCLVAWWLLLRLQKRLNAEMLAEHERWAREDDERLAEFKRLVATTIVEVADD